MLLNNFTKIVASCAISIITISTYVAPSQDLTSKMQKMGKVKEVKPFSGGLTSWILEAPNGKNAVFLQHLMKKSSYMVQLGILLLKKIYLSLLN
uniref:hypothetical protein n=1 Tax=Acinetobacter gerneri TaxID=202952 RepID=UPI00293C022A|nr:hypothetical protein [Acinetobacter gerneri]WNL65481.1 hypothetical protein GPGIFMOB_00432 [Acinetobacter gerneri]